MVTEPAEVWLLSLPKYLRRLHTGFVFSLSSKVLMNKFQRTYFLTNRKFCIFESTLIHRRTHNQQVTRGVTNLG